MSIEKESTFYPKCKVALIGAAGVQPIQIK